MYRRLILVLLLAATLCVPGARAASPQPVGCQPRVEAVQKRTGELLKISEEADELISGTRLRVLGYAKANKLTVPDRRELTRKMDGTIKAVRRHHDLVADDVSNISCDQPEGLVAQGNQLHQDLTNLQHALQDYRSQGRLLVVAVRTAYQAAHPRPGAPVPDDQTGEEL